ncbi:MAG: hypothetical protein MH252_08395 [Thermosynechococcaceae cyanobacterium MS004]|nr:hypothetical protein [Thermosynechococcaceae cyanobacterium MS004]
MLTIQLTSRDQDDLLSLSRRELDLVIHSRLALKGHLRSEAEIAEIESIVEGSDRPFAIKYAWLARQVPNFDQFEAVCTGLDW